MNEQIKKVCDAVVLGYPVMTGGYNSARITTDALKALADYALRVEKMRKEVSYADIQAWADRHSIQAHPVDLRAMFDDARTFEATQDEGREIQG